MQLNFWTLHTKSPAVYFQSFASLVSYRCFSWLFFTHARLPYPESVRQACIEFSRPSSNVTASLQLFLLSPDAQLPLKRHAPLMAPMDAVVISWLEVLASEHELFRAETMIYSSSTCAEQTQQNIFSEVSFSFTTSLAWKSRTTKHKVTRKLLENHFVTKHKQKLKVMTLRGY